ncbi:hypothetical protein A1O7_00109 [Cladophialophora yegresii CBS 114405]|uniref:Uncharacterized protein n=1 Tax=Cladophialophora yegresii CBS 114405 TaxID=1182544 RepID=W9WZW3_9EURO|nr:uncharacterized protein A1O7_00109 [Cladophialophora yegresii CBS 114405]EXJ63774.1 hypothetical protein A1O7_00109 [Cladophialophora yegresii CBS 114405]
MPGRWVRDDSQSFYYLDDEDSTEAVVEAVTEPNRRQPDAHLQQRHSHTRARRLPLHQQRGATPPNVDLLVQNQKCTHDHQIASSSGRESELEDECDRIWPENSNLKRKRPFQYSGRTSLLDQPFVQPLSGLNLVMGYNTSLPRSRMDMYITAQRQLVRCCSEKTVLDHARQRAITAEAVLWVATFRGFLYAELWRNFPCERSYTQLPPAYRPTRAQLAIPHSPMIDWMPWPDVRDMAIKFQDQIDLDDLFRVAIHNLVAHRRGLGRRRQSFQQDVLDSSRRIIEEVSDETSFRVWDVVCLEIVRSTNRLAAEPGLEKRPVLRTPELRALSRAYDLQYDEFDTQKLDDGFFEAYPCLYADTAASGWKVKRFPNLRQVDVGRPVSLTRPAVFRLKSKIEAMVGAPIEI